MGGLLGGLKRVKTDKGNHVAVKHGPGVSRASKRSKTVICGLENSDLPTSERQDAEVQHPDQSLLASQFACTGHWSFSKRVTHQKVTSRLLNGKSHLFILHPSQPQMRGC